MTKKITGKLGFRYIEDIERPDPQWAKKLENYSACNISDGLNKFYTMDYGIRQMFPSRKLAGPAVTVKVRSGDNFMLHKAIGLTKPGDVLVVESQGGFGYAVCGDIMVSCMDKLGLGGLVVDGTVRDLDALRRIGMPVFARGTVCGAGDKDGPGEVNFPVACGGVVINPGDLVFGDENGVVVIPRDDIEEVFAGADKKIAAEAKRYAEIAAGQYVKGGLDDVMKAKGAIAG
jgi:regulator of RNase E activity RraA